MRKEQQACTTDDNCSRQEADSSDSMVSSLNSRRPRPEWDRDREQDGDDKKKKETQGLITLAKEWHGQEQCFPTFPEPRHIFVIKYNDILFSIHLQFSFSEPV